MFRPDLNVEVHQGFEKISFCDVKSYDCSADLTFFPSLLYSHLLKRLHLSKIQCASLGATPSEAKNHCETKESGSAPSANKVSKG